MFLRGSHAEVLGRYGLWGNTFSSGHILIEAVMNTKKVITTDTKLHM